MASETRSSSAESQRPSWLLPLFVFGGVAGSVSVAGSLLMFVLWLLSGSRTASAPPGPVVAQQTAQTAPHEPAPLPQEAPTPAAPQPAPPVAPGPAPAADAGTGKPIPAAGGDQAPQPPQPAAAPAAPASPAVDAAVVMKPKAKRLDIGRFATIELPGEAKGFALDPESGRLAVAGPWEAEVGFLSAEDLAAGAQGAKPQTVSISGKPAAVAFVPRKSGGVFAVGTREPDGLTFLDGQSLKPLKTVPVKLAFPPVLAASPNAAASHLYLTFVAPAEGGGAKLGLARIDAERLEMDAQWPEEQFRHVSVSADGQFIYTLPNNSGEDLTRSRPSPPEKDGNLGRWDTVISRIGRVPTRYYIDPRGSIIAAGSNVYSADLSQLLMELDYDPLAFLGKKPWMAGIRQYELVIGSTNDGRAVAEVALPEEFLIPDEKLRRPSPRQFTTIHPAAVAQILADEGRGRFVLGTRRHVVTVPLETLELPDEPLLALREPPSRKAVVDNKYEVSLATLSGAPEAKLVQAPQGMVIENGVLRWTPTDNDVGFLDVRVEFKDGNVTHDEAWPLEVGQLKLDVPFAAEGCVPSADGTRAVVWGIAWSQLVGREKANSQLALVDLATRQPIAARQLDFAVARAAVGKHAVYIAAQPVQSSNRRASLIKLAPDDLRDAGNVDLEVEFLTTLADRYLICFDGRERFGRYSLPDIKPVETLPVPRRFGPAQASIPRQLGDGWLLDGVLWDDGLDQARLLVEPYGFERDAGVFGEPPDRAFRGFAFDSPDAAADAPRYDQNVLATAYTPHVPACLTVRKSVPERQGPLVPHSGRIHLDFVDRLSKEAVRSVTLRNGHWQKLPTGGTAQIATTPEHVLVTHYGEVLVVPAAGRDGPIPVPFRIAPRQSTFVLSATRPTKVKYDAAGATKFELTMQTLGSRPPEKLESADGEFEVDLRAAIPEFAQRMGSLIQQNSRYDASGRDRVEGYAIVMRDAFRQIVGKPAAGIPLLVKAEVQAYNGKGQTVRLPHAYFVDIPKSDFEQSPSAPSPSRVASRPPGPARPEPEKKRPSPPKPRTVTASEKLTAIAYSQAFQQRMSSGAAEPDWDRLKADVAAADAKWLAGLQKTAGAAGELRTWTDTQGRTVRARFVQREGEIAVVADERDRTFRIPLERLSQADRDWVQAQTSETKAAGVPAAAVSLRTLGVALLTHHDTHRSFPPKVLINADGAALLSWRVLLLESLGYQSLAAAFRYDESWNSEHNLKLVPLMPAVFRGDAELAAGGKTPYVAVVAQAGVISDEYSTRLSDLKDPSNQTLVLTEVVPAAAPVWTQPADPGLDLSRNFGKILRSRNDRVLACFADASVGTLPIGTTEFEWKKLVSIQDGLKLETAIELVPNLSQP